MSADATSHKQGSETPQTAAGATAAAEFDRPESWTRIMGMPIGWFALLFTVVTATALLGALPNAMLAGFAVVILIGALLNWIGGRVPVLRNYGLPTVLCILTPAILLHFGLPRLFGREHGDLHRRLGDRLH